MIWTQLDGSKSGKCHEKVPTGPKYENRRNEIQVLLWKDKNVRISRIHLFSFFESRSHFWRQDHDLIHQKPRASHLREPLGSKKYGRRKPIRFWQNTFCGDVAFCGHFISKVVDRRGRRSRRSLAKQTFLSSNSISSSFQNPFDERVPHKISVRPPAAPKKIKNYVSIKFWRGIRPRRSPHFPGLPHCPHPIPHFGPVGAPPPKLLPLWKNTICAFVWFHVLYLGKRFSTLV